MGISLQGELEPLLTTLWNAADSKYYNDSVPDPTNPGYVKQAEEGMKVFNNDLSSLVTRFRGYYTLDGHDLDPLVDQFTARSDQWESPTGSSVYCAIARAAGDVDNVGKLIHSEQWQGKAAMAFKTNFLDKFKNTAVAHGGCAREMAMAAKSLAKGVEHAKECVIWVCKDAISRLGGGGAPGPIPGEEDGFKEDAGFAAIVADSVAFLLAVAGPEGEALDAILAGIGVTGGLIAESKAPSHELPIGISPSLSAQGIVQNTWQALGNLDRNIAELDEQIARGLEKDLGSSGPFGSPFGKIEQPDLKPSAYHQLEFKGLDDANDAVVTSIVRLYDAGFRQLPVAAEMYDGAVKICARAHITGVQKQFPSAVAKFNEAAEAFGDRLSDIRDDLSNSGEAIVTAATHYEAADSYEAKRIGQLVREIPPPGSFAGAEHYTPPPWLEP